MDAHIGLWGDLEINTSIRDYVHLRDVQLHDREREGLLWWVDSE